MTMMLFLDQQMRETLRIQNPSDPGVRDVLEVLVSIRTQKPRG